MFERKQHECECAEVSTPRTFDNYVRIKLRTPGRGVN
jgi:hypothetical protein